MEKLINIFFSIVLVLSIDKVYSQTQACCTQTSGGPIDVDVTGPGKFQDCGTAGTSVCHGKSFTITLLATDVFFNACPVSNFTSITMDWGDGTTDINPVTNLTFSHTYQSYVVSTPPKILLNQTNCTAIELLPDFKVIDCCCQVFQGEVNSGLFDGSNNPVTINNSLTLPVLQGENLGIKGKCPLRDVCDNSSGQYPINPDYDLTFAWTTDDGAVYNTSTFNHTFATSGNHSISYTISSPNNTCSSSGTFTANDEPATPVNNCCLIGKPSDVVNFATGVACLHYAATPTQVGSNNLSAYGTTCVNTPVDFNFASLNCSSETSFSVNYGDGSPVQSSLITYSHAYTTVGTYTATITLTSSIGQECSQVFSFVITVLADCCLPQESFAINALSDPSLGDVKKLCAGSPVTFNFIGTGNCVADEALQNVQWSFSNGGSAFGATAQQTFLTAGTYTVTGVFTVPGCTTYTIAQSVVVQDCGEILPCTSCIGSFAPEPGEYIASVWVRELLPADPNLFSSAEMKLSFIGAPTTTSIVANTGTKVIDGWQRLEGKITVPAGATQIKIQLINNSSNTNNKVYFDDIRIHPFDASMKTYVYDPITLRLVAELDERNYATLYEYDEEGILIRVKKETEKGIMTIKETRQNNSK